MEIQFTSNVDVVTRDEFAETYDRLSANVREEIGEIEARLRRVMSNSDESVTRLHARFDLLNTAVARMETTFQRAGSKQDYVGLNDLMDVLNLVWRDQKIAAIRRLREAVPNLGLLEAKQYVEKMISTLNPF